MIMISENCSWNILFRIANTFICHQKNIVPPRPLNLSDLDGMVPEFPIPDGEYRALNIKREEIGIIRCNGNVINYMERQICISELCCSLMVYFCLAEVII